MKKQLMVRLVCQTKEFDIPCVCDRFIGSALAVNQDERASV